MVLNRDMKDFARWLRAGGALVVMGLTALSGQGQGSGGLPDQAEQVLALANRARAEAGAQPLHWDQALAVAALAHCRRMVAEGTIGHRYPGELDLAERAGAAGAHFALIEENVAEAPTAAEIHGAWMTSPPHRKNLLNPEVDRVGIAVIARGDELFAVADYTRGSQVLSVTEVEQRIATMIAASGMKAEGNSVAARQACTTDHGMPQDRGREQPGFVMRWQDTDLKLLPDALKERMRSGKYHRAGVGSCPARGAEGTFTLYRVAVILY